MNKFTWICDNCGEPIKYPRHGWIEWISNPDGTLTGLRLVHTDDASPRGPRKNCGYRVAAGFPLINCVTSDGRPVPDGFMNLLEFLTEDRPQKEILELIKRLYIPGYEQARKYFNEAIGDTVFDPNSGEGFYSQSDIKKVLRWKKTNAQD